MSEPIQTEAPCRADVDCPCNCPQCEAQWRAARDYWKRLYEGEKQAGLLSPNCCHVCGTLLSYPDSGFSFCPRCDV